MLILKIVTQIHEPPSGYIDVYVSVLGARVELASEHATYKIRGDGINFFFLDDARPMTWEELRLKEDADEDEIKSAAKAYLYAQLVPEAIERAKRTLKELGAPTENIRVEEAC